jgi:pimeloyl-ACP methyl ester carboxylesterase
MVDRFLVWLGVGVVTAGVTMAMMAGVGVASAETGSESGGGTKSSQESNSTDNKQDSDENDPGPEQPSTPDEPGDEQSAAEDELDGDEDGAEEDAEENEQRTVKSESGKRAERAISNIVAALTPKPERSKKAAVEKPDTVDTAEAETKATVSEPARAPPASAVAPQIAQEAASRLAAVAPALSNVTLATPLLERAEAAATATQPQIPGVVRVLGTIVFNLYAVATQLFGGPPRISNPNVTVTSSTLVLECGCNQGDTIEVPADWYIPENPEPDRLIYLQHGFVAAGPWYSHTAAALAEETNSIVVAPSITSNFLAADACWLGAPPMHEAIAGLFADGNPALEDSAQAAGYFGGIPGGPGEVVLIGHSLGGGAVVGAAGFMTHPDNDSIDRLAGVIMLDGVPFDEAAATESILLADGVPIYNLAAPRYFWNQFGVGTDALAAARPGEFIGVTLVGGSHVDAMRGGNPLLQFAQQLVTGFSEPQNVEAARILMVGWANDMFDPADPSQEPTTDPFTIDTPAGPATAVPLPNTLEKPFLLNPLHLFVPLVFQFFTFDPVCVAESIGGVCTEELAA